MSHDKSKLVETVGVAGGGNMLIHGDCLASCGFLKERIDAGQMRPVDLVYIDPPFASGFSYGTRVYLRPHPLDSERSFDSKGPRFVDTTVFSDMWELDEWRSWMRENLIAIKQVMSSRASVYVQLDYHTSAYMRVLLDEVFGEDAFRSEIIWVRRGMDLGDTAFKCAHETILHYALSPDSVFNAAPAATDVWTGIEGLYDVNAALGNYPTQKPEELLERIIRTSSDESMLVADFFGGSGVCAAAAAKLGRAFVHADAHIRSAQTARQRLREIDGVSFDVFEVEGEREPQGFEPCVIEGATDDVAFEVEQVDCAGQWVWCTRIVRSRFAELERAILDANVSRHLACILSGEETPEPTRVSDSGLELIECVSLDCSADAGAWHADAEVFIDRDGFVVKDGCATGERWDACVYSALPPKRVRVRSIRGDEATIRVASAD